MSWGCNIWQQMYVRSSIQCHMPFPCCHWVLFRKEANKTTRYASRHAWCLVTVFIRAHKSTKESQSPALVLTKPTDVLGRNVQDGHLDKRDNKATAYTLLTHSLHVHVHKLPPTTVMAHCPQVDECQPQLPTQPTTTEHKHEHAKFHSPCCRPQIWAHQEQDRVWHQRSHRVLLRREVPTKEGTANFMCNSGHKLPNKTICYPKLHADNKQIAQLPLY